jgi:hypothetical protein
MTGQDAAHTAKVFADALPLTGIILTNPFVPFAGVGHAYLPNQTALLPFFWQIFLLFYGQCKNK